MGFSHESEFYDVVPALNFMMLKVFPSFTLSSFSWKIRVLLENASVFDEGIGDSDELECPEFSNAHFPQFRDDAFLHKLYEKHFAGAVCDLERSDGEASHQLSLRRMSGVFVLYTVIAIVAFVVWFLREGNRCRNAVRTQVHHSANVPKSASSPAALYHTEDASGLRGRGSGSGRGVDGEAVAAGESSDAGVAPRDRDSGRGSAEQTV